MYFNLSRKTTYQDSKMFMYISTLVMVLYVKLMRVLEGVLGNFKLRVRRCLEKRQGVSKRKSSYSVFTLVFYVSTNKPKKVNRITDSEWGHNTYSYRVRNNYDLP